MPEVPGEPTGAARKDIGPDLAIVGAARSSTSSLAARLAGFPGIDGGSVKEPNYFSRHLDRGDSWYESLFEPRSAERRRMDASVSYTFPHYPHALQELAEAAPGATLVYMVRDPVQRAVSHYNFHRYYFHNEDAGDFGTALRTNPIYLGASDYEHWLDQMTRHFPVDQVLVVPFKVAADDVDAVASHVCERLGLDPLPPSEAGSQAHRNQVVTFRNETLRRASRTLRRSRFYPTVRSTLGADRLRRVRAAVTRTTPMPSLEESLASCQSGEREQLHDVAARAQRRVAGYLLEQDARTGLDWARQWTVDGGDDDGDGDAAHTPQGRGGNP